MITLLKWRHTASREFYISERSFTGPLTTPTHMHDFYEFLIIIDGSMSHIRNGKISLLEKNSLTLIFPDDEHFYKLNQDQSTLFINVEFSRKLFHKVVSAHSASTESNQEVWKNKSKILPAALCQAIKSRINFLLSDEIILTGINERNILMGILFDCLTYLQNSNSDEHQAPFWLLEACEALQKEETDNLRIGKLISLTGKTQEHLTRTMKRCYRITPSVYINRLKLNRAAHLIKTTDMNILEIIISCGFNNVSYFNRLFKNEYGMTPSYMRSGSVII